MGIGSHYSHVSHFKGGAVIKQHDLQFYVLGFVISMFCWRHLDTRETGSLHINFGGSGKVQQAKRI